MPFKIELDSRKQIKILNQHLSFPFSQFFIPGSSTSPHHPRQHWGHDQSTRALLFCSLLLTPLPALLWGLSMGQGHSGQTCFSKVFSDGPGECLPALVPALSEELFLFLPPSLISTCPVLFTLFWFVLPEALPSWPREGLVRARLCLGHSSPGLSIQCTTAHVSGFSPSLLLFPCGFFGKVTILTWKLSSF